MEQKLFRFLFKPPAGVWDGPIPPVAQLHADLLAEFALQTMVVISEFSVNNYIFYLLQIVYLFFTARIRACFDLLVCIR